MFGIPGIPNPFSWLAGEAGKVVVDGWTMAMLGLWNAGLWMLRLVLNIMDAFLTPDLSENGPGSVVYQYTFWIAGSLVLLMLMLQLGTAAIRRDGKSIATALMGTGQFILVWSCWIGGAVIVLAAAGGLTRALMEGLLRVNTWSAWQPFQNFSTKDISDGTVATVLGGLGCLLWLASIGHLMVMLTRAGALLVLATTTPVSAAGLVSNAGRAWFWKSLRWFIAAAFSPVIMVLVLGVGVQLTTGVANGMTDSMQKAIGTAVPGVILILISTFCPMALFKLLAFVDPGTTSGAALRAGLDAQGGIQGLFGGGKGAGEEGSSAASSSDGNGTSQGEASSEDATSGRFNKAEGGMLQAAGGALGGVAAAGLGAMHTIGTRGAAIGADLTNQMGVGHSNYYPDFSSGKQQQKNNSNDNPDRHGGKDAGDGDGDNPMGPNDPSSTTSPTDPTTGQGPSQGQPSDPTNGPTNPNQATQGPDMPAPTPGGPPSTSPQGGQQGGQHGGGKSEGGPKGGGGAGGAGGAGGSGGAAGGASEAAVVAV